MSANRPEDLGFDDQRFEALTERLSAGLSAQADRVEPSKNAYASLATAVAEATTTERPFSNWLRPLATITTAFVAIAAIVAMGVVLQRGDVDLVEAATDDPDAVMVTTPVAEASTDAGQEDDAEVGDAGTERRRPGDNETENETGNESRTESEPIEDAVEAKQRFADLTGLPFASEVDTAAGIVVTATTGPIRLDAEKSRFDQNTNSVIAAGQVTAGGELVVEVRSVLDGRVLAATTTSAAGASFESTLPVVGTEQVWLIVRVPGTGEYAAQALSYESIGDRRSYTVVRVAQDDPDGGLVVRAGPGRENASVAVLSPGRGGIIRVNSAPASVGDAVWRQIITEDGTQGWVNEYFLGLAASPNDAERLDIGHRVRNALFAASAGSTESLELPFTTRAPLAIGLTSAPKLDDGDFNAVSTWNEPRILLTPEGSSEPFTGSLLEYHQVANWADATVDPRPELVFDVDAAGAFFGDLTSVAISVETPPYQPGWLRSHVYLEQTPTGPEIVGIVLEAWRP